MDARPTALRTPSPAFLGGRDRDNVGRESVNGDDGLAERQVTISPVVAATNMGMGTSINNQSHTQPPIPLSPIIARQPQASLPTPRSPNPEFAELLTPAKLRRRRRNVPRVILPPSVAGPSREGWQTGDDVYRGASVDPTVIKLPPVEDDAISLGSGSSTSSSGTGSTWSIVSDLERGRRRTVAAIERFGERIGVRRGSGSSASSEHSVGSILEREQQHQQQRQRQHSAQRQRRLSIGHRLTRTLTRRSSMDSTQTAPRREYIPRKRQFTLLAEGQVTVTPSLDKVLGMVHDYRVSLGMDTPDMSRTVSGVGYGPGANRKRPVPARGQSMTSFVHPAVPLRAATRTTTQSRLSALRPSGPKPLTPAEIMGLPSPASAPNLSAMREFPSTPPVPTPALTATSTGLTLALQGEAKPKSCWWLDVGCPTWEDLRDIGELLALHPLTLEDVLQQDPREKMDQFDKLGYYFIVVRALDETYFKYTPGLSSVASVGKGVGTGGADGDGDGDGENDGNGNGNDASSPRTSPDLAAQNEKKRERRRRGWGMGRAVGKIAGRGEKVEIVEDNPGREGLEGVGVGAVNVYLAIFRDGIITFHFDDISKHTERVRERIMAGATEYTPDSVAHGLLDSIVDAFFPLIRYVDGEVDEIDSLTIDPSVDPRSNLRSARRGSDKNGEKDSTSDLHSGEKEQAQGSPNDSPSLDQRYDEKPHTHSPDSQTPSPLLRARARVRSTSMRSLGHKLSSCIPYINISINPRLSIPSLYTEVPRGLIYLKLFFLPITSAVRQYPRPIEPVFDRTIMLRRIVELRRIVTGMTRLLGAKNVVVGRLRKQLAESGKGAVEAYVGDVEDHILLLQTSLYHYEYILAHCQPTYLSHLKYSYHITRRLISKHILILSTVAVSILPIQTVTGLFSMNVHLPQDGATDEMGNEHRNEDGSLAGFNWFGTVIAILFVIVCIMCTLVRTWKWQARKKYQSERGREVPEFWDGYWGWK